MNINIISRDKKDMLSREEVVAEVDFVGGATPSRAVFTEEFSKTLAKDLKQIVVKKIQTHFGAPGAKVLVYVYNSEEDLKRIEPKEKAPKEEKKEEKPAEG
jgi:ribosomal protein S24E